MTQPTRPSARRGPRVKSKPPKPKDLNVRNAKDASAPLRINERHGDGRLIRDIDRAYNDLTAMTLDPGAFLDRVRDAEAGQPSAQSYDTAKVSGGGTGNPTLAAYMSRDQARLDEATWVHAMEQVAHWTEAAMNAYVPHTPKPATAKQRRDAAADNRMWCESCVRHTDEATGQPRKVEPWKALTAKTTCGGLLEVPMWLCQFCYSVVKRTAEAEVTKARLPHMAELKDNAEGRRVKIHATNRGTMTPYRRSMGR